MHSIYEKRRGNEMEESKMKKKRERKKEREKEREFLEVKSQTFHEL